MSARGYNQRCIKGSDESRRKAVQDRIDREEAEAEAEANAFIEASERAAEQYWDSVIDW